MMLRKLAVSLAVAGIISASNANALGLGEIKIHSALNEPLNAEIKLLQVRKLGPLQIQPRMADIDEFALAGLDKSRFLTDVSFQVKVNPDGSGLITMRSDRAVKEPFLNFLVEVNWPNGRLVREYTLLLDPPVFDPTPVRKTVQPSLANKPVNRAAVSPPAKVSSSRSNAAGKSEVYVDAKDTLWSIAIKHRPSDSISAKKMMIALQKKNPHAFVNNNINALRAGSVLALPTLSEINSLNSKDAALEVVRQTSQWKNTAAPAINTEMPDKGEDVKDDSAKDASKSVATEKPAPAPEEEKPAELKIVTPKDTLEPEDGLMTDQSEAAKEEDSTVAEESEETKALNERNLELEARLSESLESVDKISRENVELNERLDSIQYELEKLREMLELKDNQLAELQNKVKEAEAVPKPEPKKGFLDTLLGSPLMLGGIGAALIALLGGLFFFMRRGKDKEEVAEEAALVQVPEELTAESEETPDTEEAVEEAEDSSEEAVDDLDIGEEGDLLEDSDLDLSDTDELDELDDLDLDMDMDLDLEEDSLTDDILQPVEAVEEPDELDKLLDDDEFDLGLDDDEDELDSILSSDEAEASDDEVQESAEVELEENDALDDILGEAEEDDAVEFEVDDIDLDLDGDDEAEIDSDAEIDLGLEDDLDFEVADETDISEAVESQDASDLVEDDDGLDFVVSPDEAADETLEVDSVDSEEVDETGLDALLDSVSDDEIGELTQAAEQAGDLDDLDAILGEQSEEDASSDEPDEVSELDSILGELDDVEAELGGESDAELEVDTDIEEHLDTDDVTDADLDAMLAANADPDDVPLDGIHEPEIDADLDVGSEDLDELLASMDEPEEVEEAESDEASDDLDAMLDDIDLEDIDLGELDTADTTEDDLDALLNELDEGDLAAGAGVAAAAGVGIAAAALADSDDEIVVEDDDLESDVAQDLEADLDSELDALLSSSDDIELEELAAEEEDVSEDEDFDELAGLNLLEGADEVETKLDLARAYLDMEDLEGAKDILEEIVSEGSEKQKTEAEALIKSINEK